MVKIRSRTPELLVIELHTHPVVLLALLVRAQLVLLSETHLFKISFRDKANEQTHTRRVTTAEDRADKAQGYHLGEP